MSAYPIPEGFVLVGMAAGERKATVAAAKHRRALKAAQDADPVRQRNSRMLAHQETRSRFEIAIVAAQREPDALRDELARAEAIVARIRASIPAAERRVEELRANLAAFEIQAAQDNAEAAR